LAKGFSFLVSVFLYDIIFILFLKKFSHFGVSRIMVFASWGLSVVIDQVTDNTCRPKVKKKSSA